MRTAATPLTVYAAASAGHNDSAVISMNNGNFRTLRLDEALLFRLIVRTVAGVQVTSGVTPAQTVSMSSGSATIALCTLGAGNARMFPATSTP